MQFSKDIIQIFGITQHEENTKSEDLDRKDGVYYGCGFYQPTGPTTANLTLVYISTFDKYKPANLTFLINIIISISPAPLQPFQPLSTFFLVGELFFKCVIIFMYRLLLYMYLLEDWNASVVIVIIIISADENSYQLPTPRYIRKKGDKKKSIRLDDTITSLVCSCFLLSMPTTQHLISIGTKSQGRLD